MSGVYSCEIWIINEVERKSLESYESWRHMQISWMERKSNQDVLEIVDHEHSLMDLIKRWKMVEHT